MRRNNDCPCHNCPDRWTALDGTKPITCHGTCPRYKEWLAKRAALAEEARLKAERYAMTAGKKNAYWRSLRGDYSGANKKFSS